MPGTEAYTTTCKYCSKQIIMGINPETTKWQPWDNYASKEKHNCKPPTSQGGKQILTNAAGGISAQDIESIASAVLAVVMPAIQKELTPISQGVSMGNWIQEKVAKKVGVDDLIDDTSK